MRALAVAASLALLVAGGPLEPATADELRPRVLAPNPFAMTPPPVPLGARPAAGTPARSPVHHRPHHRPPLVSAPPVVLYTCCAGYWAYQWVPTAYTTYVWVPGYVSADGVLVGGGYQPQVVTGGYYQPVWVSGYR
jgi:hypothetical protein